MSTTTLNQFKRLGLSGLVIVAITAAIGCNTMDGFGADIEKTGRKNKKESD
jgi:predicted small secreted protein